MCLNSDAFLTTCDIVPEIVKNGMQERKKRLEKVDTVIQEFRSACKVKQ